LRTANCYSCHPANGAVDTTFVQVYPTRLSIARTKKTLNDHYLSEETNGAETGGRAGNHALTIIEPRSSRST